MEKQIKVVKIIDDMSIVINAGKEHQLNDGDQLEIYQPGLEVSDPETGESLGILDYVKARLRVIKAFPKMATCQNANTVGIYDGLSKAFSAQTAPLIVDARDISGGYENVDRSIRVGDLVRKTN